MKIFLGTDIVEIDRLESMYLKYGEKFLKKTFTDYEIDYCLSRPVHIAQRLAVRFAVKEAVSKALKVGINKLGWNKGINWKDVEVRRNQNGDVFVVLYGKALEFQQTYGITDWELSVSHSRANAVATVTGLTV
jgi:holo-[acyl-carrier protein] synthase